jgi:hypothetical protein
MAKRTNRTTSPNRPNADSSAETFERSSEPVVEQAMDMGSSDTRSTSMGSEPSEEDIRIRAYSRYLERGGGDGQDLDDWVEAERELRRRR